MNCLKHFGLIIIVGLIFISTGYSSTDKYWQQFEEALQDGLPKTAIEHLDKILEIAQKEKNYGEWMTALTDKIVLEATIQGNRPEEKVKRLKQELKIADARTKPLLKTILAHWYWYYFKRNRYRFMKRTQTMDMVEEDFTTWDLRKIFREIDSLYQDILKEKDRLSSLPVTKYLDFLESGNTPVKYRPTLFDFVAHEALGFYTCAEQGAAKPEDVFEIDVNSDAFGPTTTFLRYKPVTQDTASSLYKAIQIYQSLLLFHIKKNNIEALVDLEIHRLKYVKNAAFGEEKNKIYIQRLTELLDSYKDTNLFSLVAFCLAKAWGEEDNLIKAYEIAQSGYKKYPESYGGKSCKAYMTQLMQKSLGLESEQCISPRPSKIHVRYKNFTTLYFKIYPDKWDAFMNKEHAYPNQIDTLKLRRLLNQKPDKEWSVELSATDDLKMKSVEVDMPELAPGYYRIIASWQEDFKNSTMVQHTWLWVSNMTLVTRGSLGVIDGLVLDIVTGEPINGVEVKQVIRKEKIHIFADKTRTDAKGYFKFKIGDKRYRRIYLYIQKGNEELFQSKEIYGSSHYYHREPQMRTFFFTDRSLYRPGQTIYFKGICVRIDQEDKNYEIISGKEVTVYFNDVNNKEVARATFVSNDFGSFSGHFTTPSDRLTGRMTIRTDNPRGSTSFRVEEYKRPKFTVEIETPKQAFKLNQNVEIIGKAIAYTGAPINNALVQYRVQRDARFPYWHYWYYPFYRYSSKTQLIAHGRIQTDDEGKFKITFFAKPDLNISPKNDPMFIYTIHADVTSPDGETRSDDARVTLGYSALAVHLTTQGKLQNNREFSLQVATKTLDGNNLSGKAALKIYHLKEPPKPIPEKLWSSRYRYHSEQEKEDDEHFSSNWKTWPKDKKVFETKISTQDHNPQSVKISLPAGLYKVECFSLDKFGKEIKAFLPLMILPDWDEKKFPIKLPFVTKEDNNTVEVNDDLEILWGTGYETGRCFVEIEHDNKIIKRYWTNKEHTQHALVFPVTEKFRGGFVVHLTQVCENRAHMDKLFINVPWDNKDLLISTATFRDKLQPGENTTISLKIRGKKKFIKAAEIVAAMYDYSLDQFYPHAWPKFGFFKQYRSNMYSIFINSSGGFSHWRHTWNPSYSYPFKRTFIHFPDYIVRDFMYYRFPAKTMVTYSKKQKFKGNYGKIQGRVLDSETGEPLIGADVIIEGTELGASTDETGYYVISYVPIGTWRVVASYISYDPYTCTSVKTIKGQITFINFRLQPTIIEVKGVCAVASRPEIVVSETTTGRAVTSEEMERLPVTMAGRVEVDIDKEPGIDLKGIRIRRDLNETAFFYPHLLMDKDGIVSLEYTCPEALTKWKFMGFAHGKECESGSITEYAVTQKDLMVQPNPPRFLREGDTLFFTAKVVNMSDKTQTGRVQLDFKDLITEQPMNKLLSLKYNVQTFKIKAHISETFSWKLVIPKGMNPLAYTVVAKSKKLSDGEAGAIPVLSSRIFLTESFPLHIRGPQTKKFTFDRLKQIRESKTLEPYRFTVQMTSNPSWYAIQALPYLIEFPYECSEQIFNRLYANSLAKHIANSNPRIREVFNQWRGTDALKSNLEKNEDLKSVLITETPWVVQAQNETQAKQRIGMLFEENTLKNNLNSSFSKLKNMQLPDGSWPWFPGGKSNSYITLYITTGFGRLRHLGIQIDMSLAMRSLDYLDNWIKEVYDKIIDKSRNHLSHRIAFYLYGRSFYLSEKPISPRSKKAVNYFLKQAEQYWLELNSRMSQGYLSLALHRFSKSKTAQKIMASIKERSVSNEEMGMFWREDERSWWWYRAPIETQALMVEAFSEVMSDTISVEDCKVWLLKQKQTQHWRTTKATADVVYALILRGMDFLSSTKLVRVQLGQIDVTPEKVEAGTGFYEKMYMKNEILPAFSDINIIKEDKGIAWGGAYFQYFEEISAITPHTTNLQLDKKVFVNRETKQGTFIELLTGNLNVGDLITIRIVLRVDRDMEYVHLKDLRGSGLEPVDVLSDYRYQDGLRYYQSTKDVATHFFIDYLPKGTYVFEYNLRVQHKGQYQSGVAEIQCMYAPEFSSHSQSQWLEVE